MESPDVAWSRQVSYDLAYDYSVIFRYQEIPLNSYNLVLLLEKK